MQIWKNKTQTAHASYFIPNGKNLSGEGSATPAGIIEGANAS